MDNFVNREDELSRLRSCYRSDDAELIVIFGRRRLGKTQLVHRSLAKRDDAVIYQATETTSQIQLDEFVEVATESFPGVDRIRQNWEQLLGYLLEQDGVVVLDEFPYLIDADDSLPSVIQRLWDQRSQETAGTIVLVGSSISMMEEATLLGSSPLYGRFTEKIDLRALSFADAATFFPDDYTAEERTFAWGIFGGVPYYLDGVDLDDDLGSVITDEILSQKGYLHNEPEYVLRTELTEPNRYFAILKAIAAGNTAANEIAQAVGIDSKQISTYTQKLERLRLIEREVPITEEKPRSRRGRYRILDPLFRFWFRFVYGNEGRYERLGSDAYETVIQPELADFVSHEFETLCGDALPRLYPEEQFLDIGRWWNGEHEVDVVGFTNEETFVVGECKYHNAPVDYSALTSLETHVDELRWTPPSGGERSVEYALFSRSGFMDSIHEASGERDDLRLYTIDDVITALER